MTYELAKQLKDATFPQQTEWSWWEDASGQWLWNKTDESEFKTGRQTKLCANPTLSELVLACGDEFEALYREKDNHVYWLASHHIVDAQEGSTPEEAVAKLWLALHSHS